MHLLRCLSLPRSLSLSLLLLLALSPGYSFAMVVLQYHHIHNNTPRITSTGVAEFRTHMEHLSQHYKVISMATMLEQLRADAVEDRTVVITFDDAYSDILTNAAPILAEFGFPYTIFVATDLVGSSEHFLAWEDLRNLSSTGASFGNHSASHEHLLRVRANESYESWRTRVIDDINRAQTELQEKLDKVTPTFAYPYGEYSIELTAIVEQLGLTGFGQHSGALDPAMRRTRLPRFPLSGRFAEFDSFVTKMATLPLPMIHDESVDPLLPLSQKRPRLVLRLQVDDPQRLTCFGPSGPAEVTFSDAPGVANVIAAEELPVGRSRYNCTLPAKNNRFFWYSQPWIRRLDDGSWYPEP